MMTKRTFCFLFFVLASALAVDVSELVSDGIPNVGLSFMFRDDPRVDERKIIKSSGFEIVHEDGTVFKCYMPVIEGDSKGGEEQRREKGDDDDRSHWLEKVDEKMKKLDNFCIVMNTGGWWAYEYCRGKRVRQFHEESRNPSANKQFVLGLSNAKMK